MPRGGARVGAGRKPKPQALHVLQGTFRPARHAAAAAAADAPSAPSWEPTSAERLSLGPAGRALVDQVLGAYELGVLDGPQLLECAKAADVLAGLRADPAPDLRQVRLWASFLTSTLRALGLGVQA